MSAGAGAAERDRVRVAVLIACHDRRAMTLRCLESLEQQDASIAFEVFLVDDGSTDGTGDAVRERFPSVHVIEGSGDLYWAGGMRLAAQHASASASTWDFLLWLNDDVVLDADAVARCVDTWRALDRERSGPPIVVGATRHPESGDLMYTAFVRAPRGNRMRFDAVPPATDARRCETFNGNVVLISAEVARRVGPIDAAFTHSMGDLDYGLRAGRHGCEVWLAPGTVGTCTGNPPPARWKDGSLPLRTRLALVRGPKGLPPREWFVFTRRYGGVGWPLYWASPYVRTVLARPRG